MPQDFTMGEVMNVVRGKLADVSGEAYDAKNKGLILLAQGKYVPPQNNKLKDVYEAYKDVDGFLYLQYTEENIFG